MKMFKFEVDNTLETYVRLDDIKNIAWSKGHICIVTYRDEEAQIFPDPDKSILTQLLEEIDGNRSSSVSEVYWEESLRIIATAGHAFEILESGYVDKAVINNLAAPKLILEFLKKHSPKSFKNLVA